MSNGHRDGWNGIHTGNDLVLSEIVRNERLGGFTKYFPGKCWHALQLYSWTLARCDCICRHWVALCIGNFDRFPLLMLPVHRNLQ
ncbi:hypothetical protein MRB53_011280 [Persea americana]|uniref:Uncharacterized protein n=1 Tax=Persea americana TaxID=3435 RepID=A0ACC2LUH7_PERAE|nr:hypothetical protein MRB53_011280 [Persea americana]